MVTQGLPDNPFDRVLVRVLDAQATRGAERGEARPSPSFQIQLLGINSPAWRGSYMRQNNSRRTLQGLAFCFVLAVGGAAVAVEPDDQGELYLNSEFMIMNSFGNDLDVFEIKLETTDGNSTIDTIGLESDVDFGWRGDLQWKEGPWGVGISGFHFDNGADEDVFVSNDAANAEVVLRDASDGEDCREDTGDDDGDCIGSASSEWESWMVDLYAIRELISTPDVGLDLQAGMRIASFDWNTNGFIAEVGDEVAGQLPILSDNVPFFDSTSDSDPMVGPFLSLLATGRFGRFRLEGQLTQAVVFGDWKGTSVQSQYDGAFLDTLTLEEAAALGASEDLTVPITDIRIRVGFEVIDNLVLGFGGYATTWFNVPRPPNSVAADRPESVSTFQISEENITHLGASFSLSYAFKSGGLLPW